MTAPFVESAHRSLPTEAGTAGENWHQANSSLFFA
jgi:hypothetical protein